MNDELIWKTQLRQMEQVIRRLSGEAISEGRLDRLRELNLALHNIEREILNHFQEQERGEKSSRPVPRILDSGTV